MKFELIQIVTNGRARMFYRCYWLSSPNPYYLPCCHLGTEWITMKEADAPIDTTTPIPSCAFHAYLFFYRKMAKLVRQ